MIAAKMKKPPATGFGVITRLWQGKAGRAIVPAEYGQHSVDDTCPQWGKGPRGKASPMDAPYIAGRAALNDASELIDRFGDNAGLEAAVRAEQSRDAGNVLRFCHWRQIERVIASLSDDEVRGSIH